MGRHLIIQSLTDEETRRLEEEVERRVAEKKKEGLLTDREVKEIEEMKLKPLSDILDVQSLWEDHLYKT